MEMMFVSFGPTVLPDGLPTVPKDSGDWISGEASGGCIGKGGALGAEGAEVGGEDARWAHVGAVELDFEADACLRGGD